MHDVMTSKEPKKKPSKQYRTVDENIPSSIEVECVALVQDNEEVLLVQNETFLVFIQTEDINPTMINENTSALRT